MRHFVAPHAQRVLQQLRERMPGLPAIVTSTERGAHVTIVLDDDEDPAAIAEVGRAMLRVLDESGCEVWPTSAGRMCRSPGTGRSRVLADDCATIRNRWRRDDVRDLLAVPAVSLNALRAAFLKVPISGSAKNRTSEAPKKRAQPKGDPEGQLRGRAYTDELVRHHTDGIGRGESWDATRRWAFALEVGLGLSADRAEHAFRQLIRSPKNQATHCLTEGGRRQLMQVYRSCARHQRNGIAAGRTKAGKMSDPRVLAIVAELLGERAPKGKRALGCGSGVRITRATLDDADPVRARLARARHERSERARLAAQARHHGHEEPPCPNFDDYDVTREKLRQRLTNTPRVVSSFASASASSTKKSAPASLPASARVSASTRHSPEPDSTSPTTRSPLRLRSQALCTESTAQRRAAA
jgi:hypothetical protein